MNRLKYLFLLPILLLGAVSIQAQTEEAATLVITLERTACFGSCPVYTVSIAADGTLTYNGQRFVQTTGEQTSQIDPQTVAAMVEAFNSAGYFDWNAAYDHMTISDLPSVITSVTRDGVTHQITRYTGDPSAPLALRFLEQWIDEMANTAQWTGVQPDVSSISNGTDTPVATLQRGECFGKCPVYTVALYGDGTVVYTGIANVKTLGVQVLKVNASAVRNITLMANSVGYFNWQDRYDQMTRTDQATVITSVQWQDQSKRIVHYTGDANAPIGLEWIEQSIDQVVKG